MLSWDLLVQRYGKDWICWCNARCGKDLGVLRVVRSYNDLGGWCCIYGWCPEMKVVMMRSYHLTRMVKVMEIVVLRSYHLTRMVMVIK
jgi:hypothetical protein